MTIQFDIFGFTVSIWLFIPLVYLLWCILGLTVKRMVFQTIRNLTAKTKTQLDDILISAADLPLTLLVFASGGLIVKDFIPLEIDLVKNFAVPFKAITIVAIVLFVDKFVHSIIKHYTHRVEILKASSGVVQGFVRLIVICLGILILLDSFGVSVTPIIASLGLGSLAVALALQPTLENFFSGIQLIADKPIQIGQFIKLESGEEGYVEKIGWRSTWIRTLPNNMVVIPNKNLVNAWLVNYHYPEKDFAIPVQVGVHYESDLDFVEKVTLEVAKDVMQTVSGGVKTVDPVVRFHTFADFSINFAVVLRIQEFSDKGPVTHEFIKRLHKRYKKEGIVIPCPVQAVNLSQEEQFVTGPHHTAQDLKKGI